MYEIRHEIFVLKIVVTSTRPAEQAQHWLCKSINNDIKALAEEQVWDGEG